MITKATNSDMFSWEKSDEEGELDDVDEAEEDLFLMELEKEGNDHVGVEAAACAVAMTIETVESATHHAIDHGKEGYASLSEILEERLEDGVGIGRQRHPHEVHHLSVEHEWPEAETVEEEIDGLEGVCAKLGGDIHEQATIGNRPSKEVNGEEVAEGHYVAVGKVAAIFATEGEDEEHNEQNQRWQDDGAHTDDAFLEEDKQCEEEDKEDRAFLHESHCARDIEQKKNGEFPSANPRILPKTDNEQCFVDDKRVVEYAEIGVAIGGNHSDVVHYLRKVEHRRKAIDLQEMQWGEEYG